MLDVVSHQTLHPKDFSTNTDWRRFVYDRRRAYDLVIHYVDHATFKNDHRTHLDWLLKTILRKCQQTKRVKCGNRIGWWWIKIWPISTTDNRMAMKMANGKQRSSRPSMYPHKQALDVKQSVIWEAPVFDCWPGTVTNETETPHKIASLFYNRWLCVIASRYQCNRISLTFGAISLILLK